MQLKGFGFSGYRSFGDQLVKIAPLRKVNFIIGKNNVGKSNIINFLHDQYPYFLTRARNPNSLGRTESTFQSIDRHLSNETANHKIAFPIFETEIDSYINEKIPENHQNRGPRNAAKKLLKSSYFSDASHTAWFTYVSPSHTAEFKLAVDLKAIKATLENHEWGSLWNVLTRKSGGDLTEHWIPEALNSLAPTIPTTPEIHVIPAIRKIGSAGSEAVDFSGEGIIERLAKIQNPPLRTSLKEKKQFVSINLFVQKVLENDTAEIEIPYARDMILVHMDGRTLPLESLGTGVHEVVILAAAATLLEDTIICVEEPELHLHPLLQKKLVKYLAESTENQYFFTTHSAHLLDAVECEIFHVTHENGISAVSAIASTKERSGICNDLGYKASDLLQANCIIWVEGPSDRIYLNHWISAKNPGLIEGLNYSIMFYGGRLFSHLTGLSGDEIEDPVSDFISVRNLNRNTVIVFDSDKKSPQSKLNATKRRLKAEFDSGPGFCWVTNGREVENYLDHDLLEKSVTQVHPSASKLVSKGKWENLLNYKKANSKTESTANKVKVAKHYVANNEADLEKLDLSERLDQLCEFIENSN